MPLKGSSGFTAAVLSLPAVEEELPTLQDIEEAPSIWGQDVGQKYLFEFHHFGLKQRHLCGYPVVDVLPGRAIGLVGITPPWCLLGLHQLRDFLNPRRQANGQHATS